MKSLITALLVAPVLALGQLFPNMAEIVRPSQKNRSLYVNTTGADVDIREIMNLYSSAVFTAMGSQLSWNAGSMFPRNPLATPGKVTQSLRGLAIFDNYLTFRVNKKVEDPKFGSPVQIDFVGLRTTRDYLERSQKIDVQVERQGLKEAFNYIAPYFNGAIRRLPENYKTNPDFIAEAHSAMKMQIATRFPTPRNEIRSDISDNLHYLADSFTPLMVNGHVEVYPKNWNRPSKMQIVMLLPRIGELVTPENTLPDDWYIRPIVQPKTMLSPPAKILEVSLGKMQVADRPKNFAIKITIDKDFSKPNEMEMTLDIGQLKANSRREFVGIDFGEVEEGLVARGNLVDKPEIGVRLSFQRISLRLVRKKAVIAESVANDYQFDFHVQPKKSIKSIAVDIPKSHWWDRALARVGVWSKGRCNVIEEDVCSYVKNQVDGNGYDPLGRYVMGFVNEDADKRLQNMIPGAIVDADASVDTTIKSLFEQIDHGIQRVEQTLDGLSNLNGHPK